MKSIGWAIFTVGFLLSGEYAKAHGLTYDAGGNWYAGFVLFGLCGFVLAQLEGLWTRVERRK